MFEKFICEEAKNGNCKVDCYHMEPHSFTYRICEDNICPEKDKKVKCIEISMENYI